VDITVRGICALRAGVPGLSENMVVRSIVGRFLEHSRIFHFGNGGDPEYWIGSADMMHRNLDRRVEALVQIKAPAAVDRMARLLALISRPDTRCWRLGPDGWYRSPESGGRDPQAVLLRGGAGAE
jgi:polyphosphate kinase